MLHALMILGNAELATLARFITWLVFAMATLNEFVFFPETISFIISSNFVFKTGMLHLEFKNIVQIKVRRFELYSTEDWFNVLFHLLELLDSLPGLWLSKSASAAVTLERTLAV